MTNFAAVIDSETLARYDDAIVLSLGVVIADIDKDYTFDQLVNEQSLFLRFDAVEQAKRGRVREKRTLEWWLTDKSVSDAARRKSLTTPPETPYTALEDIGSLVSLFCREKGAEPRGIMWFDRNAFDFKKIQHIIEITCGQIDQEPWHYHHTTEIVSFFRGCGITDRYAGVKPGDYPQMVYHDPVHDSVLDFLRLQKVLRGEG